MINPKHLFVLGCILLFPITFFAQVRIKGKVFDKNEPLRYVTVVVKDSSEDILGYIQTDSQGLYSLNVPSKNTIIITFSLLGYQRQTKTIDLNGKSAITIDVTLKEKSLELDEIIVKADKAIVQKKDTIIFKTKFFVRGNEKTVEDLLKKDTWIKY